MKPIVIITVNKRYEAYNEDGRLVARDDSFNALKNYTGFLGYTHHVPLNSRLGRTILDKVELKKRGF